MAVDDEGAVWLRTDMKMRVSRTGPGVVDVARALGWPSERNGMESGRAVWG